MATVFLFDDTQADVDHYGDVLRLEGHEVLSYTMHNEARRAIEARTTPPDVAVLDIEDEKTRSPVGVSLGHALKRQWPHVPIVFLSRHDHGSPPHLKTMETRLAAWYVSKRENPVFLIRAIELVLARSEPDWERGYSIGPLTVVATEQDAEWRNQRLKLTDIEFRIVHCLASRPDTIRRYEDIRNASGIRNISDYDAEGGEYATTSFERLKSTIATHVKAIRRKIDEAETLAREGDSTAPTLDTKDLLKVKSGHGYLWKKDGGYPP
jgi:DNA-binding response OmpR family regulator